MFGTKLRNWMENHIVRPRKKGHQHHHHQQHYRHKGNSQTLTQANETTPNNNSQLHCHAIEQQQQQQQQQTLEISLKPNNNNNNNNSGSNSGSNNTGIGLSSPFRGSNGTTSHSNSSSSGVNQTGCSSVLSSPGRRCEVSPIQNHTQSRYGWQSPEREYHIIVSPKSENFTMQGAGAAIQTHNNQHSGHSGRHYTQHSAPNSRQNSCEDDNRFIRNLPTSQEKQQQQRQNQQHQNYSTQNQTQLNYSSSSFSSLSWSTGSKEPSFMIPHTTATLETSPPQLPHPLSSTPIILASSSTTASGAGILTSPQISDNIIHRITNPNIDLQQSVINHQHSTESTSIRNVQQHGSCAGSSIQKHYKDNKKVSIMQKMHNNDYKENSNNKGNKSHKNDNGNNNNNNNNGNREDDDHYEEIGSLIRYPENSNRQQQQQTFIYHYPLQVERPKSEQFPSSTHSGRLRNEQTMIYQLINEVERETRDTNTNNTNLHWCDRKNNCKDQGQYEGQNANKELNKGQELALTSQRAVTASPLKLPNTSQVETLSTIDDDTERYGRLLPSKMPNPIIVSFRSGSAECITRCCNTNLSSGVLAPSAYLLNSNGNGVPYSQIRSAAINQRLKYRTPSISKSGATNITTTTTETLSGEMTAVTMGSSEITSSTINTASGSGLVLPGQAVVVVSLSSPESAYSTGYSTDGTSPILNNVHQPPTASDSYHSVRNSIVGHSHFYPKSINSLAVEAQRNKFGLNKIEEMSPIDPLPKSSFSTRLNGAADECDGEPSLANVAAKFPLNNSNSTGSWVLNSNVKTFESPSPRQRCRIRTNPWYSTTDSNISMIIPTTCDQETKRSQVVQNLQESGLDRVPSTTPIIYQYPIYSINPSTFPMGTSSLETQNHLPKTEKMLFNENYFKDSNKSYLSTEVKSTNHLTEVWKNKNNKNLIKKATKNQIIEQNSLKDNNGNKMADSEPIDKSSNLKEKETDILSSESERLNDRSSNLDTDQDAEDECEETDDLLKHQNRKSSPLKRRTDPSSTKGNTQMAKNVQLDRPLQKIGVSMTTNRCRRSRERAQSLNLPRMKFGNEFEELPAQLQGRRKRYHKTRKKNVENPRPTSEIHRSSLLTAATTATPKARETRSVGGTPICLRKLSGTFTKTTKPIGFLSPVHLVQRSNSLIVMDSKQPALRHKEGLKDEINICLEKENFDYSVMSENEKALLRADFEADIKYRQLIMEAESILITMRNSVQSTPRETPVASPRRLNPFLTNKRIEMIKNCQIDNGNKLKYQHQSSQQVAGRLRSMPATESISEQPVDLMTLVHRRVELLKQEIQSSPPTSPPHSPRILCMSPRRTHVTNFINQNITIEMMSRKIASPSSNSSVNSNLLDTSNAIYSNNNSTANSSFINSHPTYNSRFSFIEDSKPFSNLNSQINANCTLSSKPKSNSTSFSSVGTSDQCVGVPIAASSTPTNSPLIGLQRRRPRSSSAPKISSRIYANINGTSSAKVTPGQIPTKESLSNSLEPQIDEVELRIADDDRINRNYWPANIEVSHQIHPLNYQHPQNETLMNMNMYYGPWPQSEPLRRKVYRTSSNSEVTNNLVEDPFGDRGQLNRKSLTNYERNNDVRVERRKNILAYKKNNNNINNNNINIYNNNINSGCESPTRDLADRKAALILSTLEDLKRNWERQSLQLNGLNRSSS